MHDPQPRLSGSWIDVVHPNPRDGVYWNRRTIAYDDDDWRRLIMHLRRDLDCRVLVLTSVAFQEGWFVYPSRLATEYCPGKPRHWKCRTRDAAGAILAAAEAEEVEVYVGVGFYPNAVSVEASASQTKLVPWTRELAAELWERYGQRRSFAGFYLPVELHFERGTGLLSASQLDCARRITDVLRQVQPRLPILAAPFATAQIAAAAPPADALADNVQAIGVDILAPQDGLGVVEGLEEKYTSSDVAASFARLRAACGAAGLRLWADVEVFRFENGIWGQPLLPANFERIAAQLRAVAPFVEKILCYQMPGLMTSQAVCPGLGDSATESLYQQYRHYLNHDGA